MQEEIIRELTKNLEIALEEFYLNNVIMEDNIKADISKYHKTLNKLYVILQRYKQEIGVTKLCSNCKAEYVTIIPKVENLGFPECTKYCKNCYIKEVLTPHLNSKKFN